MVVGARLRDGVFLVEHAEKNSISGNEWGRLRLVVCLESLA